MSKRSILGSCEVTFNYVLNRLSKLEGEDKKAIENEFREWLNAIQCENKNYDVLYINKINP